MTKIITEKRGDVWLITINRPETRNGLDRETRLAMRTAIDEGQSARAIAITGAGENFSAGQDLREAQAMMMQGGIDAKRILDEEYEPILHAIDQSQVPIIALVHGSAVGAGLSLALACDLVLAATTTRLQMGFGAIALAPDVGLSYVLPRLIGQSRAMAMALSNEPIDAKTAREWGMIWQVLPDDGFLDTGLAICDRIAANARGSNQAMRDLIRHSLERDYPSQLAAEAEYQAAAMRHPDFLEGAMAFMQKRLPKFRG